MTIAHLTSPTAVRLAISECDRLGRDTFLFTYGFGHSREYPLLFDGREYDSKAIAGVAFGYQFPDLGPLSSHDFSGGISPQGAATKLSKLGFAIAGVNVDPSDWSLRECEITADAYFKCLEAKLAGRSFNRQAVIRQVASQIDRSEGAIDYKFQNIDAILYEAEQPRLGRAVASGYQRLLQYVVLDPLANRVIDLFDTTAVALDAQPTGDVIVPAPSISVNRDNDAPQRAVKIDFALREAKNRSIGLAGEEFVVQVERKRLTDQGRADLAEGGLDFEGPRGWSRLRYRLIRG